MTSPQDRAAGIAERIARTTSDFELYQNIKQNQVKRLQKKILAETVAVHVTKIAELPGPLAKREFAEVCKREGISAPTVDMMSDSSNRPQTTLSPRNEAFAHIEDLKNQERKQRMGHTINNLYGAYIAIYNQFKTWHNGIIQNRTATAAPASTTHKIKKFKLTEKEQLHIKSQQKLVSLLIEYGIGSALETGPISPGQKARVGTANEFYSSRFKSRQYLSPKFPSTSNRVKSSKDLQAIGSFDQSSYKMSQQQEGEVGIDIIDSDEEEFGSNDSAEAAADIQTTRHRLKLITSKRDIAKDIALSRQKTRKIDLKQLNDQELNDDNEFFSEVQQRFRQELIDSRQKIIKMTEKLKLSEQRNLQLISRYTKEEVQRSVHSKMMNMPFPEQADLIKNQIDASFYNVAEGLDPSVAAALNNKIQQIKDYFVSQVQLVSHHSEALRQNVALMENMNKGGIKFAELDTDRLIAIIADVEKLKRDQNQQLKRLDPAVSNQLSMNRPFTIWNMIHKHFGPDYFLEVIEEEYGITPGANEFFTFKIQEHFDHSLNNYKTKLSLAEKHYQEQIELMQHELQELTETNARLMRHDQVFLDKALLELRRNQRVLAHAQEDATIRALKKKYIDARDKIGEMIKHGEDHYRSLKGAQKNYCWKKWQMFSMISKIIKSVEETNLTKIDSQMLKICEQFIIEEELILRYSKDNDVPKRLVATHIRIDKKHKYEYELAQMRGSYGFANNNAAAYSMEIEGYRAEIEKLRKTNRALRLEIPALKASNDQFMETLKLKEKTEVALLQEIKNLEYRWKNGMKEPKKYSAKAMYQALQLKSIDEFSSFMQKIGISSKSSICKLVSHQGTMTYIADLSYKVDYEKLPQRVLGHDKGVDATAIQYEDSTQTEPVVKVPTFDAAVGTDQETLIKSHGVDKVTSGMLSFTSELHQSSPEIGRKQSKTGHSNIAKSKLKTQTQLLNSTDFKFPGGGGATLGVKDFLKIKEVGSEQGSKGKRVRDAKTMDRRHTVNSQTSSAFRSAELNTLSLPVKRPPFKAAKKQNLSQSFMSERQKNTDRTKANVKNNSPKARGRSQLGSMIESKLSDAVNNETSAMSSQSVAKQRQQKNQVQSTKIHAKLKNSRQPQLLQKIQPRAKLASSRSASVSRQVSATQTARQQIAKQKSKHDLMGQATNQEETVQSSVKQVIVLKSKQKSPPTSQVRSSLDKKKQYTEHRSLTDKMHHQSIEMQKIKKASTLPCNEQLGTAVASARTTTIKMTNSRSSQHISQQKEELTNHKEEFESASGFRLYDLVDCQSAIPTSNRQRETDQKRQQDEIATLSVQQQPPHTVIIQSGPTQEKIQPFSVVDVHRNQSSELMDFQGLVSDGLPIQKIMRLTCVNESNQDDSDEKMHKQSGLATVDGSGNQLFTHLPKGHFLKQSRISEQPSQELAQASAQSPGKDQRQKYVSSSIIKLEPSDDSLNQKSSPMASVLKNKVLQSDQTKIKLQKLLLKGHINEEQFLCLQLLEKGYIPARKEDNDPPQISSAQNFNMESEAEQSTSMGLLMPAQKTRRMSPVPNWQVRTSQSPSPGNNSPGKKRRNTIAQSSNLHSETIYRIYPNKQNVLSKILDRVYSQKCSVGVQCDNQEPDQQQSQFRLNTEMSNEIIEMVAAETGEEVELVDAPSCLATSLFKKNSQRQSSVEELKYYSSQNQQRKLKQVRLSHSSRKLHELTMGSQQSKNHKLLKTATQPRYQNKLFVGRRNTDQPLPDYSTRPASALQKWLSCITLDDDRTRPLVPPKKMFMMSPAATSKASTQRLIKLDKHQGNASRLLLHKPTSPTTHTNQGHMGLFSPQESYHNLIVPKTSMGRHSDKNNHIQTPTNVPRS